TFLFAQTPTTDASGHLSFSFGTPVPLPPNQYISVTATDPAGGTSGFSRGVLTAAAAPAADLSVAVAGAPSPVAAGAEPTFTVAATAAGPAAAEGVTLTPAVPAGSTFVAFSAPAGWTVTAPAVGGTGTVSVTAANLTGAASAVFTLTVRVAPGTA